MSKQIKVSLVNHMGGDIDIVNAARVSFNKQKDVMDASDEKLIKYLADHKHMTPFRHNAIQLRCKGPLFLAAQLKKHQAGLSWNEISRRYVDSEPEFYLPPHWRARPSGSVKQGSGEDMSEWDGWIPKTYTEALKDYEYMLDEGIAPELARMVLPQSMLTEWIWTGNLLAFAHVYKERIAEGAQLEAQMFAKELDEIIRPLFPEAWSALVDD